MSEEVQVVRRGREGSRWINERPTGEAVAAWFTENVPMHDGMDAADFVGGVTIIPAKEKYDAVIGYRDDGSPVVAERQALTFTPYIRVDTRVRYFWAWMEQHPEWLGTIERVPVPEQADASHLPDGFFYLTVERADNKRVTFIGCSMRVRVRERDTDRLIINAPSATKMVPVLNRFGEDVNALMKAETGAIGRALGFAGVLVAPGSGIATAEDVQESMGLAQGAGATPPEPQLPASQTEPESDDTLREYAERKLVELREQHPALFAEFRTWAQEMRFATLADISGPQLKGVVRKIDRMLDEAAESAPATDGEPALVDAPKPETDAG